jgi:hypothetical protein
MAKKTEACLPTVEHLRRFGLPPCQVLLRRGIVGCGQDADGQQAVMTTPALDLLAVRPVPRLPFHHPPPSVALVARDREPASVKGGCDAVSVVERPAVRVQQIDEGR